MMVLPHLLLPFSLLLSQLPVFAFPGWASLEVLLHQNLAPDANDFDGYDYPQVQITLGTPPQSVYLTVSAGSTTMAVWSSECAFCRPKSPFYPFRSSTLHSGDQPWEENSVTTRGTWHDDTIGFGGLKSEGAPFVLVEALHGNVGGRLRLVNGRLGILTDTNQQQKSIFNRLWDQGALLNPVIGLRLDSVRPRMTIGALDPEDYEGEINWVEVGTRVGAGFNIDGIKGYNGSLIPVAGDIVAALSTLASDILVPSSIIGQYFQNPDYYGPEMEPSFDSADNVWTTPCPAASVFPSMPFTIIINGVDYPTIGNNLQEDALDDCLIRVSNTSTSELTDVLLGLPFMKSVYVAYRFPTSDSPDCPGYIGFGFPTGLNYTTEQFSQVPRTTPQLRDQCLSIIDPTEAAINNLPESEHQPGDATYPVYGDAPGGTQVPLVGANELKKRGVYV